MTAAEGDWRSTLVEVNRKGRGPSKVVVAHLHPGTVSTSFQRSLAGSTLHDLSGHRRLLTPDGRHSVVSTQQGAGRLERGRNDSTAMFLDSYPDADLLLFADSDMGWDSDAVETIAQAMDDTGHPILGALCFGAKPLGVTSGQAMATEWFPTLYRWVEDRGGFDTAYHYPQGEIVEVGATGAAFLMIRRSCLTVMRNEHGDHWFDPITVGDTTFGEDLSFCLKARDAGFSTRVHTGVGTSHNKDRWYNEADYLDDRRPRASAVTVVIPAKDRLDLTRGVVSDLNSQGGWTDLLIFDNGSTDPEMKAWLADQSVADVYDASDADTISQMWNAGIDEALVRHGGLADVVLLNNDLQLGPRFCQRLVGAMRDSTASAVCGNYDARRFQGVAPVQGIAGGREDGTGGFAGFAFALRAEWIASGYRFPPELHYFSDNDLCLSIQQAGGWYGMASDAFCTHVNGGGQTAGTLVGPSFEADRAFFAAKWEQVAA